MPLQTLRVMPPVPVEPTYEPQPQPTGDPWKDYFENVVRPARDDPREQEIAMELRKRIQEWESADTEWLRNTEFELDFLSGKHWLEPETGQDKAKDLIAMGRSAFTIDLLTPSVELIVNQVRINKLTANFIPLSGGANPATAEVRQGLYRNIDRVSKAAIARETAYWFAVTVGRGYERILIEDEEGPTFNKKISIKRVDNIHTIAIDPTCLDFNYADAAWAYTFDDLWKDEFREQYGQDAPVDVSGFGIPDDATRNWWFPNQKVKVGEYFRRVWKKREVWRLEDRTVCWKEDAPPGARPVAIKEKMDSILEWRKMTGTQTLEKRIWPGKLIPIVVFIGREVFRGKLPKIHSGMVKPAVAPSRIHDYMESRTVDEVGLSPLPHMFSATGHLSVEQKRIVNEINKHPWSNVEYTPIQDEQGRQLPPPAWASPSPNTAAVVQAAAGAKDNLQRVLNTFAPQLGQQQGQQSGRAIGQIRQQGDVSHASFPDNYNRAITYEGEVVNELMDTVYTDAQAVMITDLDESTREVLLNQEHIDSRTGKKVNHLFGAGHKYGIAIQAGPSFLDMKSETATKIMELAEALPAEVARVLDLLALDMGIPNAKKYADRWRPPGFKADDQDGPDNQELQQRITAYEQQAQQAGQLINQLLKKVAELGSKEAIQRLQIASKERIAAGNQIAQIVAQEAKTGHESAHSVLLAQLQVILKQLDQQMDVAAEASADQGGPAQLPAAPAAPANPAPSGLGMPAPATPALIAPNPQPWQ